jgi:hypothetical protein
MMRITGKFAIGVSFVLACLWAPGAHARWATPEDAEAVTESSTHEIELDSDYTYTEKTDSVVQVLREGGRHLSTYHLNYNSRARDLKVEQAETINEGKSFPVDSEYIEDKPMASRLHGFDQYNMVAIAFPKVGIGSRLHLKVKERQKEVSIPEHFSEYFDFGTNWYVKAKTVTIRSKVPLIYETNDPGKKLELTDKKDGKWQVITIRLKEPIYTRPIDEQWASLPREKQTWVVVSSAKSYSEIGEKVAKKYEEVLTAELPASYSKIVEKAREASGAVEQINAVTSGLAEEVRYMGDWRPVNGGHIPRALERIAKTKFGDCKDFAASTVAMLRKLGYKAQVTWVERAHEPTPLPKTPLAQFNHAIVRAEAPAGSFEAGRIFWVDPTNFASFAQGINEDIIGRQSLVIEPGRSRLEDIPAGLPSESLRESRSSIALNDDGSAKIDTKLAFKGRAAFIFAGATLKFAKPHIDHILITILTDLDRLKWKKIDEYDLSSRITKDTDFHVVYGERNYSLRTTVGPAVRLEQRAITQLVRLDTLDRVSDVFLGVPDTVRDVDFLADARLVGHKPPECRLDSKWVRISRQVTQEAGGLRITDVRENKVSRISNAELLAPEFAKFQEKLQRCFDRIAIVFEPLHKARAISSKKEVPAP